MLGPLTLAACTSPSTPPATDARFTLSFVQGDGEVVLQRDDQPLLALPLAGIALGEVPAYDDTRSWDPANPGGVTWRIAETATGTWPALTLGFDGGATATLTASERGEGSFALTLTPSYDDPVGYVRLTPRVDPEEGFYGLGSALDAPNRRGSVRAVQVALDVTTEATTNEAHVHLPFVVGTTGWGLLVRDDHPATVAFGVDAPDEVAFTVGTGEATAQGLAFDLYAADHPLDVTARYWAATGIPRLPARWALGPWVWRDENDDQAQVEADLRTIRELDLATSGVWIDRPYASGVNTFDFDPVKFPDPTAMIDLAHALGFRMALWPTPYVDETEAADLYAEAIAGGFFAPEHPPVFIDWSSPIDFTNPAAYDWWQALIGRYTAMGIEGYKLDYAEEVLLGVLGGRLPWTFADGSDERTMHAQYQRLYHQVYAETLPAEGGFLLCRTGAWGDQVNGTIIWPGDLDATMAAWGEPAVDRDGESYVSVGGLPASLVDALSLGPSGFPFYGSDTGGYRQSPPDNETFVRWFEQTALSTVMQIGTSSNDVAWEPTAENGFTADTLTWYRDYVRLHLRLWPYLWTYADAIARGEGRPVMRALGLAHPELGVHPGDTYLLGDHLLVAPVVVAGARERTVVFPAGRWIDWFRGEIHEAGTETVSAALSELPLYLAEGGIVPLLRPTIDTLAPTTDPAVDSYATDPGLLWARVFPGPTSSFTLFDGSRIDQQLDGGVVTVGFTAGAELSEGLVVELIGVPEPGAVAIDGVAIDPVDAGGDPAVDGGWRWTEAIGGTLTVRIGPGQAVTVGP
ncbi:MAG: TIM-barrel domain-containing protein [Myxococcota bacterium]